MASDLLQNMVLTLMLWNQNVMMPYQIDFIVVFVPQGKQDVIFHILNSELQHHQSGLCL